MEVLPGDPLGTYGIPAVDSRPSPDEPPPPTPDERGPEPAPLPESSGQNVDLTV